LDVLTNVKTAEAKQGNGSAPPGRILWCCGAMKACVVNAGRLDFDRQIDFGRLEASVEVSVPQCILAVHSSMGIHRNIHSAVRAVQCLPL